MWSSPTLVPNCAKTWSSRTCDCHSKQWRSNQVLIIILNAYKYLCPSRYLFLLYINSCICSNDVFTTLLLSINITVCIVYKWYVIKYVYNIIKYIFSLRPNTRVYPLYIFKFLYCIINLYSSTYVSMLYNNFRQAPPFIPIQYRYCIILLTIQYMQYIYINHSTIGGLYL